jgi:hypothetical protein
VLDTTDDSVNFLRGRLGKVNKYLAGRLVLRNLLWGRSNEFQFWEKSNTRARFLQIGREHDFPKLWQALARTVHLSESPDLLRQHDRRLMGIGEYLSLTQWVGVVDAMWDQLRSGLAI